MGPAETARAPSHGASPQPSIFTASWPDQPEAASAGSLLADWLMDCWEKSLHLNRSTWETSRLPMANFCRRH